MADTTFVDQQTVVTAEWLNDVNDAVYDGRVFKYIPRTEWAALKAGTSTYDCTTAVQSAINASIADGTRTVYVEGKLNVTAPLTYTGNIALQGVCGDNIFTNDFDKYPVRIRCNTVTGYLFDQPDTVDGSGGLTLTNICFDGRSSTGVFSTTWQGVIKASTTSGTSSFYARMTNCAIGCSNTTEAMLQLSGEVFARFENCFFVNWYYGYGVRTAGNNILGTTISFEKCYFNSLRQVGEFYDNQTDVQFDNCVIESCNTGVAALKTNVVFNQLYSENMGYDPSGTAIATGLTPRAFGVADAPAIAGNMSAMFLCRYGQMIFNQPTFLNTTGGRKWFDGIGRFSALGQGGLIEINNLSLAAGTISTLLTADADAPSSKANFEYTLTVKNSSAVIPIADVRLLSRGVVHVQYSDGNLRTTEVDGGNITIPSGTTNGITAMPTTIYPDSGAWRIGDSIILAQSVLKSGFPKKYACSAVGTTSAGFNIVEYIPISKQQSVAAAGTMTVQATIMEARDLHTWEVLASTGANINSFYRVTMQAFSGVGQLYSEGLVTTNTLTFTMGWGGPYTITITNTSGATLNVYARLVSVTSCHP